MPSQHAGTAAQYRLYDTLDGLAGRPFGHISSSRADNGTPWFIRGGGLTQFAPDTGGKTSRRLWRRCSSSPC